MNIFQKGAKLFLTMALALVISVALTQDNKDVDYVVVVYENVQDNADVFSYPAEFYDIIQPYWPGIKVDLRITTFNTGGGGSCEQLLLDFWNAVNEVHRSIQLAEDIAQGIELIAEDGKVLTPAEAGKYGQLFVRKAALFAGRQRQILAQMESRGCEMPVTPLSSR